MNKGCAKSKSRLKKETSIKKACSEKDSDTTFGKGDLIEIDASGITYGYGSKDITIQELGCGDVTELLISSQEQLPYSSQDITYEQEVRWDYQSPETVKKLKKCRGQYSSQEVKSIVANFKDTNLRGVQRSRTNFIREVKFWLHQLGGRPSQIFKHIPYVDSSLHSLKLYLPTKNEVTLSRESRLQKEKEKVSRRCRRRLGKEDSVQQMIKFLQDHASRPITDNNSESTRSSECFSDNLRLETENSDTVSNYASSSTVNGDDSLWSDEDLFKDNSFLIEATQNPEKFLNSAQNQPATPKLQNPDKFLNSGQNQTEASKSYGPEMSCKSKSLLVDSFVIPPSCSSKHSKSLLVDSSVIPPSCSSKQSSIMGTKPLLNVPSLASDSSSSNVHCAITKLTNFPRTELNNNCISGKVKNNFQRSVVNQNKTAKPFVADSKPLGNINSVFDCGLSSNVSTLINSSKGKLNKNNRISEIQSSPTVIVNPPPKALIKTSFRKFNSFQIDILPQRAQNSSDSNKNKQETKLNSSFRKTLSFDSSFSPSRKSNNLQSADKQMPYFVKSPGKIKTIAFTSIISEPNDTAKMKVVGSELHSKKASCVPGIGLSLQSEPASWVPPPQEDGFDISLPDDAFETLAEVDEVLNSQGDVAVVISKKVMPKRDDTAVSGNYSAVDTLSESPKRNFSFKKFASGTSASKTASVIPTRINNSALVKPTNIVQKKDMEANSRQLVPGKILPSPVRSVTNLQNRKRLCTNSPTQAYYKKTFSIQKDTSFHRRTEMKIQPSLPCSSTPVKKDQSSVPSYLDGESTANTSKDYSASFLDSVFDDSFTNDEALFESQILPALEKAEAEVLLTQKTQSCPVKCSSKEIEQKRQTALQKRSLRLSQKNMANGRK